MRLRRRTHLNGVSGLLLQTARSRSVNPLPTISGLPLMILPIVLIVALAGCDPAARQEAKKKTVEKAKAAETATTQAAENVKQTVKPYVEKGVAKVKSAYEKGKQKMGELVEDTKPYLRKAEKATTQAVQNMKSAATQAVEKFTKDKGE